MFYSLKQFLRETRLNLEEGKNAKNAIQAYQKQITTLKKDICGLRGQNKGIIQQMHGKDNQIQQLKKMLARNSEKKSRCTEREWQSRSFVPTMMGVPQSPASTSGVRHREAAAFENYIQKKGIGEITQERHLIDVARKKIPIYSER